LLARNFWNNPVLARVVRDEGGGALKCVIDDPIEAWVEDFLVAKQSVFLNNGTNFKIDREFKPYFHNRMGASGIIVQLQMCVKFNYVPCASGHLHIVG
jgi:hypothetical protein